MHYRKLFWILPILGLTFSCKTINSNRILFYQAERVLKIDSLPQLNPPASIIPGDVLGIEFYPNQGEAKLLTKTDEKNSAANSVQTYVVDQQGMITLPLLGSISVTGKTLQEIQILLTRELEKFLNEPYVKVTIVNERVMLFSGKGAAKVIQLENQNTSILEVIALGGGLAENTKSTEIHLVRTVNGVTKTYRFDISELQNLKAAGVYVRNHDIVVVNYYPRKFQSALKEINPWLNLATVGFAIFSIILRFTK